VYNEDEERNKQCANILTEAGRCDTESTIHRFDMEAEGEEEKRQNKAEQQVLSPPRMKVNTETAPSPKMVGLQYTQITRMQNLVMQTNGIYSLCCDHIGWK
jgi:hypothetical protein